MHRHIILIGVLGLVSLYQAAGSPITLPCNRASEFPVFWLNSTTQSAKFYNHELTVFSNMHSGRPYLGTWQSLRFVEVHELRLVPQVSRPDRTKCATGFEFPQAAEAAGLVLQSLNFEDSCDCTIDSGRRSLAANPAINEAFIEMKVTHQDLPNFLLTLTFSLVDRSHSIIVPPTQETLFLEYPLNWTATAPKCSLSIENWNWTQAGAGNSNLRLYFLGGCQADEDTSLVFSEKRRPYNLFTTNTTNTYFQSSYLRAFAADGVDYVIADTVDPDTFINITKFTPSYIPIGVSMCNAGQPPPTAYTRLLYDPSIVALFSGADDLDGPVKPNDKNRLNPAAYAVPIGAAVVLVGAAAVILFVPGLRHKIFNREDPFSRGSRSDLNSHSPPVVPVDSHSTPTMTSLATESTGSGATPSPTESKSSWARSAIPQQP